MEEFNMIYEHTPEEFIRLYNDPVDNINFTRVLAGIERDNKEYFLKIIKELNTGKYKVKYLNAVGE